MQKKIILIAVFSIQQACAMQQTGAQFAVGLLLGAAGKELRTASAHAKEREYDRHGYSSSDMPLPEADDRHCARCTIATLASAAATWYAYYKVPHALAYIRNEPRIEPLTKANWYAIFLGCVLGNINAMRAVCKGVKKFKQELYESDDIAEISWVKNLKNSLGKACSQSWNHLSFFEKTEDGN